ncbi:MAG: DoxX family membrane protein [Pseudomonadota bacterium]|nr:DoxX family membrane protein [Pseudomonadota bacterium]
MVNKTAKSINALRTIYLGIPDFCLSHWLLRVPLAVVFLQHGLSKFPVLAEDAESFGLPYLVWWFVTYGEIGSGFGLLVGGLLFSRSLFHELGDLLTRFSGITICSIATGVIWISEPESLVDVILYDNLHVFLWVGGLFFALRGNRI